MEYKNSKNGTLAEEAEAWLVMLRSDNLTRTDKVQFSRWLNTSPAHRFAFDEALEDWQTLGAVIAHMEDFSNEHASDFEGHLVKATKPLPTANQTFWHRFLRPIPAAAMAASLVLAIGFVTFDAIPDRAIDIEHYASSTGQTQRVTLADGSEIQLNTNTRIEVAYSDKTRQIRLLEGEAYFAVAKDRNRPFVVDFGSGTATAVGTAFNIYSASKGAAVTVTEGIVDVRESADLAVPNPDPLRVRANQQVRVSKRGLSPVRLVNVDRAVAWRERTIIFKDTPLKEALAQLNRYMEKPAYGKDIGNLKISGTFSLSSPAETLDAIVAAFNLKTQDSTSENVLYLLPE